MLLIHTYAPAHILHMFTNKYEHIQLYTPPTHTHTHSTYTHTLHLHTHTPPTHIYTQLQGGKQYFDSGEYNRSASKKERQEISSLPHATDPKSTPLVPGGIPPHLAHMRARPKAPPSRLAAPAKSPLSD